MIAFKLNNIKKPFVVYAEMARYAYTVVAQLHSRLALICVLENFSKLNLHEN